jgi:hypothetical protein
MQTTEVLMYKKYLFHVYTPRPAGSNLTAKPPILSFELLIY